MGGFSITAGKGLPGPPGAGALFEAVALLEDRKTTGTYGGVTTGATHKDRDLNTIVYDGQSIILALSSPTFTLGAGTYLIKAVCPAYGVNQHQCSLYSVTAGAALATGSGHHSWTSDNSSASSLLSTVVTLLAETQLKIRHYTQTARGVGDLGVCSGNNAYEVYTQVEVWKFAV